MSANGTFYDRINVLGAPASACTTDNERGYSEGIEACLEIAEDADAMVDELVEAIEDALRGNYLDLGRWCADAKTLVERIKFRRKA